LSVVELGGGNKPTYCKRFGNGMNIDCRAEELVDIVADLEKTLPLPDASCDHVISVYAIEHLSWRSIQGFISEIYRILKPSCRVIIVTANLLEQAKLIASKQNWDGTESNLIFGSQDYSENSHKCGFSPEYLEKCFKDAGFSKVITAPLLGCPTDLWLEATK